MGKGMEVAVGEEVVNSGQASVYFLVSADKTKFKLGVSVNVLSRIVGIGGPSLLDMASSRHIVVPDAKHAFKFERIAHFIFEDFNIKGMKFMPGGGLKEWFDISCFNDTIQHITYLGKAKGLSLKVENLPSTVAQEFPMGNKDADKEIKRVERLEKAAERLRVTTEKNKEENSTNIRMIMEVLNYCEPYFHSFTRIGENNLQLLYKFDDKTLNKLKYEEVYLRSTGEKLTWKNKYDHSYAETICHERCHPYRSVLEKINWHTRCYFGSNGHVTFIQVCLEELEKNSNYYRFTIRVENLKEYRNHPECSVYIEELLAHYKRLDPNFDNL